MRSRTLEFPDETVGEIYVHDTDGRWVEHADARGTVAVDGPVRFAALGDFVDHPSPLGGLRPDSLTEVSRGSVGLFRPGLDGRFIERLHPVRELTALDLGFPTGEGMLEFAPRIELTDDDLAGLSHFQKLQRLVLELPEGITDAAYRPIGHLRELRSLRLRESRQFDFNRPSDAVWRRDHGFLSGLRELRRLWLGNVVLAPHALFGIARKPHLEELQVGGWAAPGVVEALRGHRRLRSLHITSGRSMEIALDRLARLPTLERLRLSYCSAEWVEGGDRLPTHLRSLRIDGSGIDADGLAVISRIPNLEHLDIGAADIEEADLEILGRMARLRSFGVEDTNFDERSQERIRRRFPEVDFTFHHLEEF